MLNHTADNILLIGAELQPLRQVAGSLRAAGYQVDMAGSVATAWRQLLARLPHLVLIDVSSASEALRPWELCRAFSPSSAFEVALVSPQQDRATLTRALANGARGLVSYGGAAIELAALLGGGRADKPLARPAAHHPALEIDWEHWRICRGREFVNLSRNEFGIISYLAARAGDPVPAQEIYSSVWKRRSGAAGRALLKVYVARIRQKIESNPDRPRHLKTVRGVGYTWEN